ncbi:UDP-N-acetylmuramoyl-L-alanyl-D-glutamate--2,6-diaminopimelate ligase [Aureispira sp. CCB-E]|uniref:UDP-N-acetylmuramoyl-L-alanyl-D-glutamate--2, 6-diaminopimelate ligase n=1 Tax=Aureispira sp. CCB-E TaxID=3051121 RepID=UPI0028687A56|nr:UDP-N-acetylmuramoyl-L-alanyl-D-glutamate--2,6-diaminopimelate ligase [Aureispira sp. CCB-E]WMX13828.1 UDP-N-acetylmuramoyl-L-alanyl-D-glutamate--2,6-diaminopimelate ligase [Aureispira sp. CCB-E]
MKLNELLKGTNYQAIGPNTNPEIESLQFDSRKVVKGALFVAIKGVETDGHLYIDKAIQNGACVVLCEQIDKVQENVLYIRVRDTAETLGHFANTFYGAPSQQLKLVGVTGTNGKTTTVTLLHNLFSQLGYTVGLISTVENKIGQEVIPSTHTTPDVITLNQLLVEMNHAGCEYAFMEVSSHAVDQKRIAGIHFEGGVFSNITHDHLDYHKTFQNYIYAKKGFFDALPKTAFALTNLDDKRGEVMLQNTVAQKATYALRQMADFKGKIMENNLSGLVLYLDGEEVYARLVGGFNAYNLLSVYATARLLGADKLEVLAVMSNLAAPEGRFDYIQNEQLGVVGIVDYAHTPDALEKVLQTIDKLRTGNGRIITVVGCGGDRDKTKRPLMAKVACDYSQQTILTSDNPRTEEPEAILLDMEQGVPPYANRKTLVITDRKQAIRTACQLAQKGDIILVAGKGHEKYQDINGVKHPFDDKEELRNALNE